MADLLNNAVKPLLGDKNELTEADWATLQVKLAPFDGWSASKAGANVEKLGLARVKEILGAKAQEKINVGYVTASDFLPLLVAKEKGFFEKSGQTARDLVASGLSGELLSIEGTAPVEQAAQVMPSIAASRRFSPPSVFVTSDW